MPASAKQQILSSTLSALAEPFPAPPEPPERPVLDEVVYGIVREGVLSPAADAAYARLKQAFFDWNEVRVSTVQELADVLADLPHPGQRAVRVIEFIQEHFERTYSFDLEDLEKKGLRQAAKQLARYKDKGVSDFVVAWVSQRAFGGHALPLDEPVLRVLTRLRVLDDADPDEPEATRASVEHHVPKAKGWEFTEEVSQLAAAICLPDVPLCPQCPLNTFCPTGLENVAKSKAKPKK